MFYFFVELCNIKIATSKPDLGVLGILHSVEPTESIKISY